MSDQEVVKVSRSLPATHAVILGVLTATIATEIVGYEWPIHALAVIPGIGMIIFINEVVMRVGE